MSLKVNIMDCLTVPDISSCKLYYCMTVTDINKKQMF